VWRDQLAIRECQVAAGGHNTGATGLTLGLGGFIVTTTYILLWPVEDTPHHSNHRDPSACRTRGREWVECDDACESEDRPSCEPWAIWNTLLWKVTCERGVGKKTHQGKKKLELHFLVLLLPKK
jgi:hypothetical protein